MTTMQRTRRTRLYLAIFASALGASPALVTRWWPAFGVSDLGFWYWLIASLAFIALLAVAVGAAAFAAVANSRRPAWSEKARTTAKLAGASVAAFVAVLGIARVVHGPLPTGSHVREFDPQAWRMSPPYVEGDITPRQKMLGDVVEHVLPGKSRQEIEAALGPSEDTAYFAETGRDLIYITGPERDSPFPIDSEWLLIWLDDDGRFERFEIARD